MAEHWKIMQQPLRLHHRKIMFEFLKLNFFTVKSLFCILNKESPECFISAVLFSLHFSIKCWHLMLSHLYTIIYYTTFELWVYRRWEGNKAKRVNSEESPMLFSGAYSQINVISIATNVVQNIEDVCTGITSCFGLCQLPSSLKA